MCNFMHIFVQDILFLIFFSISIFLTLMVIFNRNILNSILSLIFLFLFVACFMLVLGAEFLSFLLLIVYVGAISILFSFVIMLLDIRTLVLHTAYYNYFTIIAFTISLFIIIIISLLNLYFDLGFYVFFFEYLDMNDLFQLDPYFTNLELFGMVLYNHSFFYVFFVLFYLVIVLLVILLLIFSNVAVTTKFVNKKLKKS